MGAVKELVLELENKGYTRPEIEKYFEMWCKEGGLTPPLHYIKNILNKEEKKTCNQKRQS